MSFRRRLVLTVTGLTAITLGGAFGTTWFYFNRSQERALDQVLMTEAKVQVAFQPTAQRLAALKSIRIADSPMLPTFAAWYSSPHQLQISSPNFYPPSDISAYPIGYPFDIWNGKRHLRAVVMPIASPKTSSLLFATTRSDIDGDRSLLGKGMLIVFLVAVGWAALVANWLVGKLTQDHEAIISVVRRVAAGDLKVRLAKRSRDRELAQLADDIDDMIERLDALVSAQRRFVAHAAHELRSPLTTLYGELQHALAHPRDNDEYRLAINEALDSTRELKSLTEDLLAFARMGTHRGLEGQRSVSMEDVVSSAMKLVEFEAEKREVTFELRGTAPPIMGHASDLERMVRNLLENAIRYAGHRSHVELELSVQQTEVWLSIHDEGPGIPKEEQEQVFEPFYRSPRNRGSVNPGTGLGLAIAREIARNHGGDVRLDPNTKKGALFVVRLKAHLEQPPISKTELPSVLAKTEVTLSCFCNRKAVRMEKVFTTASLLSNYLQSMHQLLGHHGYTTVARALRVLLLRLKSRADTQLFAETVQEAWTELQQAHEAWEQARAERLAISAEIEWLDARLDKRVMTLAHEALKLWGDNRNDPRYARLFPISPAKAMAPIANDTQARFVRGTIDLLKHDPELTDLENHASLLQEAQEALNASLHRREELYLPESVTSRKRREALDKSRRSYNRCYPMLKLHFEDEPALVESFFVRLTNRGLGEDEDDLE
jgi:two-component system, OmpR family, sensor kinase